MFTYMASYITRINYGAVILEMVYATGYGKAALSMALTGSFITYGAGQIVSGVLGDKFRPKILVFCGLILSVCMNVIIPFCPTPVYMLVVWCVNGFAQAFMWPPIVRLMTVLFEEDDYLLPVSLFESYLTGVEVTYDTANKVCRIAIPENPVFRLTMDRPAAMEQCNEYDLRTVAGDDMSGESSSGSSSFRVRQPPTT